MSQADDSQDTCETARLLTELDRALNESSVIRDIASKYQALRDLEHLTGPSHGTRRLRNEILELENLLRLARS